MNEVLVSGLGVVSPHGNDTEAMFAALLQGESAVRPVFPELARPAAAAAVEFDETRWFNKLQLAGVDRVSQMAVAAASLALDDAGGLSDADPERVGVYVGCGMGGAHALDVAYRSAGRVPPLTIPAYMPNAPAAHVALRHGVKGPVLTYSVACASSSVAIAEAAKAIRNGEVDVAIAGGSEALLVPGVMLAWQAMMTLASFAPGEAASACRPFANDRTGFVLGEGAAFMVLESGERATSTQGTGVCTLGRMGLELRRIASHQARRRRPRARPENRPSHGRFAGQRRGLLQRPRHGHQDWRQRGGLGAARGLGGRRRATAGQFHQGPARPLAGRSRRPGSRGDRVGAAPPSVAAQRALRQPR